MDNKELDMKAVDVDGKERDLAAISYSFIKGVRGFDAGRLIKEYNQVFGTNWVIVKD